MTNPIKAALGVCRWQTERERERARLRGGIYIERHWPLSLIQAKTPPPHPAPTAPLPTSGHQHDLSTLSPRALQGLTATERGIKPLPWRLCVRPHSALTTSSPNAVYILTLSRLPLPSTPLPTF